MSNAEMKQRKRSLLVILLVFSLLVRVFCFGRMETHAATQVGGVSLTVEYNTGGVTAAATQTYYRYYIDEAAGTMDASVTITMPSESEISMADGQLLTAWEMTDPIGQDVITLLPGDTYSFDWESLLEGQESSQLYLSIYGNVREYSVNESFTGEDYNTYAITNYDSIGDISINRTADGFTVTAPGTPVLESHAFDQWQLLNSDYMPIGYATAGGVFQSPDGGDLLLDYSSYDTLYVEAVGIPMATINFYKSMFDTDTVLDTITVTKQTDDNGTKALSFTWPSAPEGEAGSVFLAWYDSIGYSYRLPGTTVTYNDEDGDGYADWPSLGTGYVTSVYGSWLDVTTEYGDVVVTTSAGEATVTTYDTYFTLTAPSAPTADGYLFTGWTILLDNTTYEVTAGEIVSDENNSPIALTYENYDDVTVTFIAQWERIASIYYHQDAEGYKIGSAMHVEQINPEYDASGAVSPGIYTTYGSVSLEDGGLLLGWTNVADGSFLAPEVETTFEWDQLDDKNSIHLIAVWLYTDWVLGDGVADWQEKVTIVHETDGMYSLTLPEKEPVMPGYSFDGWEHAQNQQTYRFAAGENTSNQGLSYTYPSENEVTHEFVAQWTADPTPTPTPTNTPTPTPTNTPTPTPTNTPTPTPTPVVVSAGVQELSAGQEYRLPEGKWVIDGDTTVYEGGMVFYVPKSGTYNIKEGE